MKLTIELDSYDNASIITHANGYRDTLNILIEYIEKLKTCDISQETMDTLDSIIEKYYDLERVYHLP